MFKFELYYLFIMGFFMGGCSCEASGPKIIFDNSDKAWLTVYWENGMTF